MSQTRVAHTKPLSRMQRLSESRGGLMTKPIFSNTVQSAVLKERFLWLIKSSDKTFTVYFTEMTAFAHLNDYIWLANFKLQILLNTKHTKSVKTFRGVL